MSILAPALPAALPQPLFPPGAGPAAAAGRLVAAGAANQATQPAAAGENLGPVLLPLLGGLALAALIAAAAGVFRRKNVDGPLRVAPGKSVWPLALALGAAVAVWLGSQVFYVAVKQVMAVQRGAGATPASSPTPSGPTTSGSTTSGPGELSLVDLTVLSTVPGVLAFGCLFSADRHLSETIRLRLGFTAGRLPGGVAKGLLALLIVMPLMFVTGEAVELLYRRTHIRHPGEHMLLKLMGEAPSPLLKWCLIGGALVTAPFFEEYLFRGFLQTLLRETFIRGTISWRATFGQAPPTPTPPPAQEPADGYLFDVAAPTALPAGSPQAAEPVAVESGPAVLTYSPRPPEHRQGMWVWQTWAAIIVTSLAFALIHELWTAPIIFVLALCLGYAYERTGSLWTTITIHLLFNATSTWMYLGSHG